MKKATLIRRLLIGSQDFHAGAITACLIIDFLVGNLILSEALADALNGTPSRKN
jgi:hypothetical protein